ncbi:MAG: hypothetical protein M1837_003982 [Sclerophora amabilis]|nr:MAG: hypothetical protein M1837_003982 [Sclerophora amabilis]
MKSTRLRAAVIFCVLLYTFYAQLSRLLTTTTSNPLEPALVKLPPNCDFNRSHLQTYGLSSSIQFARRYIEVSPEEGVERAPLIEAAERLLPDFQTVDLGASGGDGEETKLIHCDRKPLHLKVPPIPPTPDVSSVLFGASTTASRLRDSIPQFHHWMRGTGASLLVVVPPDPSIEELQQEMHNLGLDVDIQSSDDEFVANYFSLVERMYSVTRKRPRIKWVSFIDDDTFFPSMTNLLNRLSQYNPSEPWYIGSLSEDMHQVRFHGVIGFGGGGLFLSIPLLEQVHVAYPLCKEYQIQVWGGDAQLFNCISNYTTTKMTIEKDLHQMDFYGNPRGIYEAGRPMLSLHHWKSWHHLDVLRAVSIGKICGDACILQRWKFLGQDSMPAVVLTNGFSIIQYLNEVPDLMRTEKTFEIQDSEVKSNRDQRDILNDFAHSVGPLRRYLEEGKDKLSYDLADLVRGEGGEFKQVYIRKGLDGADDGVVELIWTNKTIVA